MIITQDTGWRVSYHVQCDGCDARGPQTVSEAEARSLAERQGFKTVRRWDPREYANVDYCPDCYQRWTEREMQARDEHEHWTEPDTKN